MQDCLQVYPDHNELLTDLARSFQMTDMNNLAKQLRYDKHIFHLSADLYFIGWLEDWKLIAGNRDAIAKYRAENTRSWRGRKLYPHPVVICRATLGHGSDEQALSE